MRKIRRDRRAAAAADVANREIWYPSAHCQGNTTDRIISFPPRSLRLPAKHHPTRGVFRSTSAIGARWTGQIATPESTVTRKQADAARPRSIHVYMARKRHRRKERQRLHCSLAGVAQQAQNTAAQNREGPSRRRAPPSQNTLRIAPTKSSKKAFGG